MGKKGRSSILPVVAFDACCVISSPIIALVLRNNLDISLEQISRLLPYTLVYSAVAGGCFALSEANCGLWSYASLPDVVRIAKITAISILLSLLIVFATTRLDNVPRSLPIIQFLVVIVAMAGARGAYRHFFAPFSSLQNSGEPNQEQILLIGLSEPADVYLRVFERLTHAPIAVAGVLTEERTLHGRYVRGRPVDGSPADLNYHLQNYEVHGINVRRAVICVPWAQLSAASKRALLDAQQSSNLEIDMFADRLALVEPEMNSSGKGQGLDEACPEPRASSAGMGGAYAPVKRSFDILGALSLLVLLSPLLVTICLLVIIDLGLPVTFWQQRPGRFGKPFRIYKFRTMRPVFDSKGRAISPENRRSLIGGLLRRSRVDELPQLYNILIGDMSFVGPRPLLPIDQPRYARERLMVRPGLTGWAQINGGRDVSIEEKDALDCWYARHASFGLDVRITLRTVVMLIRGDRRNAEAIRTAIDERGALSVDKVSTVAAGEESTNQVQLVAKNEAANSGRPRVRT